jgi:hypothetical protein
MQRRTAMSFGQSVEDSRGAFERLVSHIPGYHGYKEKENRRAADKLLREYLSSELDEQRRRLAELQRQMLDAGGLLLVDDVDRAVTKVQKLADMVRTASYGYAGLFDAIKVKEDELDAIYAFDEGMLTAISDIKAGVDGLAAAIETGGDMKTAIQSVVSAAEAANVRWRERENVVTGAA